jgi:monovalent cation:H+ antiporter, CPA1 family
MGVFAYSSIIITVAVIISYLNHRFIRLQATIAIMSSALLLSLILIILDAFGINVLHGDIIRFFRHLDFHALVMNFMLGLLLFAGALTIDLTHFKSQKVEIAVLTSISTIASAFLVAAGTYYLLQWMGFHFAFVYCMLFGSLISPTDPIAVLAIFKKLHTPKKLETLVSAEALFNDGVGVVLFVTTLSVAFSTTHPTVGGVLTLFFKEAVGGIAYGLVLGWLLCWLIKPIYDHKVEILLTIALVTGGYTFAQSIGISGPLAMVTSGIFIANYQRDVVMTVKNREMLNAFWELIDELLNTVLFLLLGFEILAIHFTTLRVVAALAIIPLVLLIRYVTVAIPIACLRPWRRSIPYTISILTWGGLRGGLAVALALSIPVGGVRAWIVTLTYAVVVFSIVIQGTTMTSLAKLAGKPAGLPSE